MTGGTLLIYSPTQGAIVVGRKETHNINECGDEVSQGHLLLSKLLESGR